jgi:hypothetical protein
MKRNDFANEKVLKALSTYAYSSLHLWAVALWLALAAQLPTD